MKSCAPLILVLSSLGCGNLSNEDLVFLAGVPAAEEVTFGLAKPQPTGQPLTSRVGEPAEYYLLAQDVSGTFDEIVEAALHQIASLGRGVPPTSRSTNGRVWGPAPDGTGLTRRLEIHRAEQGDATIFDFCLHVGLDTAMTGESPSCGDPNAGGLRLFVWGWYEPLPSSGEARSGRGELHIDFETARLLDPTSDERGLLSISYSFANGGMDRRVSLDWVRIISLTSLQAERFHYRFDAASTGALGFEFVADVDVVAGSQPVGRSRAEELAVVACWGDTAPGRAEVSIRGGDLEWGESAVARECWVEDGSRAYWRLAGEAVGVGEEEGDPANCRPPCVSLEGP